MWNKHETKMINFFGGNPSTVKEDVAKIVEWEEKIGNITDHEYSTFRAERLRIGMKLT